MRADYGDGPDLDESWLADGWEPLLRAWLADATSAAVAEPNAMVLATVEVTAAGPRPVSRTVLCKQLSPAGVIFYTSHDSAKGQQLAAVPYASATFVWPALERQVHVQGPVRRVDPEVTRQYWRARPRDSQLGAWASQQSQPVASRAALDAALTQASARFADTAEIPVPPQWGGYLVAARSVEFWQGRHGRLHNRLHTSYDERHDTWQIQRLQP